MDCALQIAVVAVLALATLVAVSGILYWLLWLLRLSRPANWKGFIAKPIPGLRRGKVAGQEFEMADVVKAESETLKLQAAVIEDLNFRLDDLEVATRNLADIVERFEDVSGRA